MTVVVLYGIISIFGNKRHWCEVWVIYQAAESFAALIEQAGLTQAETATQAGVNRYHLAHVAAGRRNLSGAYAARIASVYAARTGMSHEEAMTRLFVSVRARKSEIQRPRGALGRFIKTDAERETT